MKVTSVKFVTGYTWDQVRDSLDKAFQQEKNLKVTHIYDPSHNGLINPWGYPGQVREFDMEPTHLVFTHHKGTDEISSPRIYLVRAEPS